MVAPSMLASFPASMLNQNRSDLGTPNRFIPNPSRSSGTTAGPKGLDMMSAFLWRARPLPNSARRRLCDLFIFTPLFQSAEEQSGALDSLSWGAVDRCETPHTTRILML